MAGVGVGLWILLGLLTVLLAGLAGFLLGYLTDAPAKPPRPRADSAVMQLPASTQPAGRTTVQAQTP